MLRIRNQAAAPGAAAGAAGWEAVPSSYSPAEGGTAGEETVPGGGTVPDEKTAPGEETEPNEETPPNDAAGAGPGWKLAGGRLTAGAMGDAGRRALRLAFSSAVGTMIHSHA